MPEDVKEMLGLQETSVIKSPRGRSKKKHVISQEVVKKPKSINPPTVKEKFEQHAKRKVIDEYLNTPKKRPLPVGECPIPFRQKSAKEQQISVINVMKNKIPSSQPSPESSPKHDLSDVIIAAAAAKMVKLNPAGDVSN